MEKVEARARSAGPLDGLRRSSGATPFGRHVPARDGPEQHTTAAVAEVSALRLRSSDLWRTLERQPTSSV